MRIRRAALLGVVITVTVGTVYYMMAGSQTAFMLKGPKAVHGGRLFPVMNFSGRALQRDRILHRAFQWQHGLFQDKDVYTSYRSRPEGAGPAKIVLIVAYLRSGSTFTASLLTQNPEVFYVFEPLHTIQTNLHKYNRLRYINGTVRHHLYFGNSGEQEQNVYRQSIDSWLKCDLENVDVGSLMDKFHSRYSKSMRPFLYCVYQQRSQRYPRLDSLKTCLSRTQARCSQADMRVFKTIRLSMTTVKSLIESRDDIKVVHLVRDPRGMMLSQRNNQLIKTNDTALQFQNWCTRMYEDILVTRDLLKNGAKNIKLIRYEDIAFNPIQMTKELFEFIVEPLTQDVLRHVAASTSMNAKDNCAFCTRRGNSSLTASKWRININQEFLALVDKHCQQNYEPLGYYFSTDADYNTNIRNVSKSVVLSDIPILQEVV